MPPRVRSTAWNYFQKEGSKARCNICHVTYSYKATSGNLKSHLKKKHNDVYRRLVSTQGQESAAAGFVTPRKSNLAADRNSTSDNEESSILEPDSELWGFFDKESNNRAKCSMCGVCLKADTKILYKHLKEVHSKISQNLELTDCDENYTEVIYLEEPMEVLKQNLKSERVFSEVQSNTMKHTKQHRNTTKASAECQQVNSECSDNLDVENFGKYITGLMKGTK